LRSEDETGFPKLSAPARRALAAAGFERLDQLAEVSESDVASMHGIGPTALSSLSSALHERGLSFRTPRQATGATPGSVPAAVEEYLRGLEEPKRSTLEALRDTISK
jgi:hypothetical protein